LYNTLPVMTGLNILLITIYKLPEPVNEVQLCKKALRGALQIPGNSLLLFSSFHPIREVFDLAKDSGDSLNLLSLRPVRLRPLDDQ